MKMRPSGRKPTELRKLKIEPNVSRYAEGSCMITCGGTRVLCTATVEDKTPPFLKNTGKGWVTAEYGMLPRATDSRMPREAAKGKQSGRTQEIQRLIGRSLRSVVDLKLLGERQIIIDCDVIEADGGTRCASITGGYVALALAIESMRAKGVLKASPLTNQLAAVSCGLYKEHAVLDLDYIEDSTATMDANFVLTADGKIVEIQCTAEESPVTDKEFAALYKLAKKGIKQLAAAQVKAIAAGRLKNK
jgi:ribonuclease PH